jgi:hexulose-6-phosphate isomerase
MKSINRRDFLKASSAGLALSLLPRTLAAAPAVAKAARTLKKGYMLNTYPGKEVSVLEKFKNIRAAGFAGVEASSHMDQHEVLRAQDQTGLLIPSVVCGQHSRALASADPTKHAEAVEGVKQALRDAKKYGASSVLVVPGGVSEETSYADNYRRTQEGLRKTIPLAEELGVKLAFENVWNHFLLSPMEAARYVDEFKSSAAGWHFDVGNVIFLGWPEQWIHILGKRIQKIHIKEYSRKLLNERGLRAGFEVEYLEGDNDWPAVMKALDGIGYSGWLIAEPAWRPKGVAMPERLKTISEKMDRIIES